MSVTGQESQCSLRQCCSCTIVFLKHRRFFFVACGLALALADSCFPWNFIHQGRVSWGSFCSAWVWPPGDAQQIAREPVSCDTSVFMGTHQGSYVWQGLFAHAVWLDLEFCCASLGDRGKCCTLDYATLRLSRLIYNGLPSRRTTLTWLLTPCNTLLYYTCTRT
jgi:hypothetical protein